MITPDFVEIWFSAIVGCAGAIVGLASYAGKIRAERELETLKRELQIHAAEHRARFAKLHDRRAETIADLYGRIAEFSVRCAPYFDDTGQGNAEWSASGLAEKASALCLFFETHQIYLSERLCMLLEKRVVDLRASAVGVLSGEAADGQSANAASTERREAFIAAARVFAAEIPTAKKALKDELRKMFGAESASSAG